jgi:hypothetical protein
MNQGSTKARTRRTVGRPSLLSQAQKNDVRCRLNAGELGKALAEEYGVSDMVISRIRNEHNTKPEATPARIEYLTALFWRRVAIGQADSCWPFDGATFTSYGRFSKEIGGSALAHITAFALANPSAARPDTVRHLCDNRACCNPAHLRGGTKTENSADRTSREALVARGHSGPTPVTRPVAPPKGGWPIHTDLAGARLAWDMDELLRKVVVNEVGCWLWDRRAAHPFGYGQIRGMNAHRYAFTLHYGYLPPKKQWILHRCGVAECCNPEHLYAGTPKQNAADTTTHGRRKTGTAHPNAKFNSDQVRAMRERYCNDGLTLEEVAVEFAVALGSASRILKGQGYPDSPGPTKPALRGTRVRCLNAETVTQARLRARDGETVPEIARSLGIHVETVRDAVTSRSWRQVALAPRSSDQP